MTMLRTLLIETLRDHESDPTGRESKALDSINLLVIACELPVLTNSEAYHCDNKEVHVLLTILFGWKRRKPKQRGWSREGSDEKAKKRRTKEKETTK